MVIDFEKFPLLQGINGEIKEVDIKNMLSDVLYTKGTGIAFHALALKIYNSKEGADFDEGEINLLVNFAEKMCSPNFIDSLRRLLP